ncbi:MAG TPA: HNH endonuclease, partial [Phycisphaerales bacterium]|nr:HNH endonuclease [Phycisphaerales bacterium]
MAWTREQLTAIYDRTSGYCHLCGKKLALTNYAAHGHKGAWEVEHSVPRACGGSDRLNNLYAAHISCN